RYTYQFMESSESFTVCAFPPQYRKTLTLLGTKSGREIDKVKASELTPIPSSQIDCPGFAEADLILECRKIYFNDLQPANAAESIHPLYPDEDYHRLYFGEILAIHGEPRYQKKL
ncbi:MAG TPA: flavin reductase, partial [Bacillota bacterium]